MLGRIKGTILQGFARFWVKDVMKFKLNIFSYAQIPPERQEKGKQAIDRHR